MLALFDRGAGIGRLVERLIEILDAIDAPEEDFENGADHDAELDYEGEATLGAPEQHHNQLKWGGADHSPNAHLDGELEPSLGAPEAAVGTALLQMDQTCWARGSGRDLEADAGNEPEIEDEHGHDLDAAKGRTTTA